MRINKFAIWPKGWHLTISIKKCAGTYLLFLHTTRSSQNIIIQDSLILMVLVNPNIASYPTFVKKIHEKKGKLKRKN
jgi:hypothetical protein